MPALAKRSVGSSYGIVLDEGTNVCCFDLKKSKNAWRTSGAVSFGGAILVEYNLCVNK